MARLTLSKKIEQDVANGTVALALPTETNDETVNNAIESNEEIVNADNTDNTNNTNSQEYINFSNNLTDLLLKYAIEYRYYVESYNKVERTYQPSSIVMEHMRTNKYIADEAKEKLSADVRRQIEAKLDEFRTTSGENYESAVSGLAGQITAQQSLRNSTLNAQ